MTQERTFTGLVSYTFGVTVAVDTNQLRVNASRMLLRLAELARIGDTHDGGCARLALTDEDRQGRDLVIGWMRELGLEVTIDQVGNVFGTWSIDGRAPVMTGSHIDTVRTGGRFDGNYGVLAGLEVIHTLQDHGLRPGRSLSVAFFTNEEGARFAPDMFGSLVHVGGMSVEEAHATIGIDGAAVGDELERIGYLGTSPCPGPAPHAFVELHIEQGPILESEGVTVGAVTGVQGISWMEVIIEGQSNHAGTTPMNMRRDPALVCAEITVFLRSLALRFGGNQVCTVGKVDLHPNLVNVVPASARMTLDVRNTDEDLLRQAEEEIAQHLDMLARRENVTIRTRVLARFAPVEFSPDVIDLVDRTARRLGHTCRRLPSGAGHDAQMLARTCPSGMIFVPSIDGISHNPRENTDDADLEAGANVLLHVMLQLAEENRA